MSSDLLAEFDSFYNPPQESKPNPTPAANDLSSLSTPNKNVTSGNEGGIQRWPGGIQAPVEDIWGSMGSFQPDAQTTQKAAPQDDIWGSFEASIPESQIPAQSYSTTQASYGGFGAAISGPSRPAGGRRSTLDLFTNNMNDTAFRKNTKPQNVPAPKPAPVRKPSYGADVLFDADEVSAEAEDDDEFGDFETVTSPEPPMQPPPSQSLNDMFGAPSIKPKPSKRPQDLLPPSTSLNAGILPYPQAPKSPSFQERNPFTELGLATKQVSTMKKESKPDTASPVTAWPSFQPPKPDSYQDSPRPNNPLDEDWGDFADLPPETPVAKSAKALSGIEADAWAWDNADRVAEVGPPPTNIPPPSVILALFPPLFDLPQSKLFKVVANQPFSLKNRIISDPTTVEFLRAYLLIATVAARVIAGRKLRWKRDTLLSQAMKIGPAAAGGKGGMKLMGVDKSEVIREDREAADVVRIWKEQLGRLRSAIAVANTSMRESADHLIIPEITEAMHVKTQEGALSAPKPCIICGLKREERINKVDVGVEDSFGEWWIEYWGHRACRNFWQEHESRLKHR